MVGDRSQLLLAASALVIATLAPVPAGAAPDLVRTLVPLEGTDRAEIEAALADTGGQLLRIDQTLGFAVVTTPRPANTSSRRPTGGMPGGLGPAWRPRTSRPRQA